MQQQPHIFNQIMQHHNALLEAAIIQQALQFKLTIQESINQTMIYFGTIRNISDHGKLSESFETFEQVLQSLKDPKTVRISLDDMSITLIGQFGIKIIELVKIMLQKQDGNTAESFSLEDIIDKCNEKNEIDNHEIKMYFQTLAKQIIQLKQQHRKETFQCLKDEFLAKINAQSYQVEQRYQSLAEEHSQGVRALRKEIESIETENVVKLNELKEMQKVNQDKCLSIESLFKRTTDELVLEMIELKESLNQNKSLETLKKVIFNQSQKLQKLQSRIEHINFYIRKQKQEKQTEKYSQKQKQYKSLKYFKQFKFDGTTLIKINQNSEYYYRQFIFFEEISVEKEFRFYIKIVKTYQKFIYIGIIDYNKYKQQEYAYRSPNTITYGVQKGYVYPGKIIHGNGVAVGQIVEIRVDRKNNMVRWIIDGKERAYYDKEMLGDKQKCLYPCVEMKDAGDTIEIFLQ